MDVVEDAGGSRFLCRGREIPLDRLRGGPSASTGLPQSAQLALRSAVFGVTHLDSWRVLRCDDSDVTIGRERTVEGGPVRAETISIHRGPTGGEMSHGWGYVDAASGPLVRVVPGLKTLRVAFDPAHRTISAEGSVLRLLVVQEASGLAPGETLHVVQVDVDADRIVLLLGVAIRPGPRLLVGYPPSPFTLDIRAPLGDRQVLDGALLPPQPLPVGFPAHHWL